MNFIIWIWLLCSQALKSYFVCSISLDTKEKGIFLIEYRGCMFLCLLLDVENVEYALGEDYHCKFLGIRKLKTFIGSDVSWRFDQKSEF